METEDSFPKIRRNLIIFSFSMGFLSFATISEFHYQVIGLQVQVSPLAVWIAMLVIEVYLAIRFLQIRPDALAKDQRLQQYINHERVQLLCQKAREQILSESRFGNIFDISLKSEVEGNDVDPNALKYQVHFQATQRPEPDGRTVPQHKISTSEWVSFSKDTFKDLLNEAKKKGERKAYVTTTYFTEYKLPELFSYLALLLHLSVIIMPII